MKHAHLIVPHTLVAGSASGELLYAPTGLSLWGGVDRRSAEVIDRHHPLSGRHLHGRLLAIPGGRGSCTGSSVLLELILGGPAPAAILLREPDEILALGAIVAEELFGRSLPIACLGEQRQARVLIEVDDLGNVDDAFYPTLGYLCGLLCDGQIPAIDGLRQRQPDRDALKAFGARLVTDTCWCMLDEPLVPPGARTLMTNSVTYAHYAPGLTGRQVRFAGLADCVETGVGGRAPAGLPAWLSEDC
ncbi:TPA: DUF126 domain-containing protein [Pseudomonas aeruginosa]|nr:DUF126 domain-containing protein [Pseudomonas aeruginosa]